MNTVEFKISCGNTPIVKINSHDIAYEVVRQLSRSQLIKFMDLLRVEFNGQHPNQPKLKSYADL